MVTADGKRTSRWALKLGYGSGQQEQTEKEQGLVLYSHQPPLGHFRSTRILKTNGILKKYTISHPKSCMFLVFAALLSSDRRLIDLTWVACTLPARVFPHLPSHTAALLLHGSKSLLKRSQNTL